MQKKKKQIERILKKKKTHLYVLLDVLSGRRFANILHASPRPTIRTLRSIMEVVKNGVDILDRISQRFADTDLQMGMIVHVVLHFRVEKSFLFARREHATRVAASGMKTGRWPAGTGGKSTPLCCSVFCYPAPLWVAFRSHC